MPRSTHINTAEGHIGSVVQAGDIYGDLVIADDEVIIFGAASGNETATIVQATDRNAASGEDS